MVEGHQVHRVAERHRKLLLGKVFKVRARVVADVE